MGRNMLVRQAAARAIRGSGNRVFFSRTAAEGWIDEHLLEAVFSRVYSVILYKCTDEQLELVAPSAGPAY